jgi:hypothetical protein
MPVRPVPGLVATAGTVPGCDVGTDPAPALGSAALGDTGDTGDTDGAGGVGAPDDGVAGAGGGGLSDFNADGSAPVAGAGVDAADGNSSAVSGGMRFMSGAMSAAC